MALVIKCAGEYMQTDRYGRTAAFGFTVRDNHKVIYREADLCPGGEAEAKLIAVCRALRWLATCSNSPADPVEVRVDTQLPGSGHHCHLVEELVESHRLGGRDIHLVSVSPEWVSEAGALCRRAIMEHMKHCGMVTPSFPQERPSRKLRRLAAVPGMLRVSPLAGAEAATLTVMCDGSYKPDRVVLGTAAYGCMVWENSRLVHRESGIVCRGAAASSEVAEIGAVVAALRWLATAPIGTGTPVEIRSDSRHVVERLSTSGTTCTDLRSASLFATALQLLADVESSGCQVYFWHVTRTLVAEADLLARRVHNRGWREADIPLRTFLSGG